MSDTDGELCVVCSMALLHLGVAMVICLILMDKTGECGGVVCLPKLEGVNHKFGILRWKENLASLGLSEGGQNRLEAGGGMDA